MPRARLATGGFFLFVLLAALAAASISGCVGPDTHYESFEFVEGEEPGDELPSDVEVNESRDYLVLNVNPFGQELNGRVNFTGRYYRMTGEDGETVEFSHEEAYNDESLGLDPSGSPEEFEERVRGRGDVESLEVVEVNRSHEFVLGEGESVMVIELHPRTLAGDYRGRLWKGDMENIPIDKFNFTLTPKRAAGLRR